MNKFSYHQEPLSIDQGFANFQEYRSEELQPLRCLVNNCIVNTRRFFVSVTEKGFATTREINYTINSIMPLQK
ncbi:hypothetical protein AYI70_g6614 [Smittium culicis]|uniref:Uncharacterized protein n=1 Tax=Smittium culicis TaxID=133412 RepID=A0A1R1XP52_9FUNG|nr:hypothetical protein AYI70_g6614 [Smittium culicis]